MSDPFMNTNFEQIWGDWANVHTTEVSDFGSDILCVCLYLPILIRANPTPSRGKCLPFLPCPIHDSPLFDPSYSMPPTRSSKRNKDAAVDGSTSALEDTVVMSSTTPETIVNTAAEAVEESSNQMTGIEENGKATTETVSGTESKEGSENGKSGSETPRLTMEERKAKMEQLRKKIVRLAWFKVLSRDVYFVVCYRQLLPERTVRR